MTFAPVVFPALPMPEMARPIMNAVELGAAAQMIEPISNMATSITKAHLAGKNVYCTFCQLALS
jgi:hypothetical protein